MKDFADPSSQDEKIPNPFVDEIFVPHATPLPGISAIHDKAMEQCVSAVEDLIGEVNQTRSWGSTGRTLLISSPRAGYGKTHLVGRLRSTTEALVAALDMPFCPSKSISWQVILAAFLQQYRRTECPQNLECSLLDETARFYLSSLVRANLTQGALDERDCPESAASLRMEFREIFSRSSKSKILSWVNKKGGELARYAAPELGPKLNLSAPEVAFWTGVFTDYAQEYDDALEPLRGLSDGEARERVLQLMRLASECRPIALVVDHLDGFHGSDSAGMAIAEMLTDIRTGVPKSLTLLCLNDDVWESVFASKIPSAWLDRLEGEQAKLSALPADEAQALVCARLESINVAPKLATEFASELADDHNWGSMESGLFPRQVIRQARRAWQKVGHKYFNHKHPDFAAVKPQRKPVADYSPTMAATPEEVLPQQPVAQETPPPAGNGYSVPPPPIPVMDAPIGLQGTNGEETIEQPSSDPHPESAPQESEPGITTFDEASMAPGLNSIIDDIRDSGSSVVSKNGDHVDPQQAPPAQPQQQPIEGFQAPPTYGQHPNFSAAQPPQAPYPQQQGQQGFYPQPGPMVPPYPQAGQSPAFPTYTNQQQVPPTDPLQNGVPPEGFQAGPISVEPVSGATPPPLPSQPPQNFSSIEPPAQDGEQESLLNRPLHPDSPFAPVENGDRMQNNSSDGELELTPLGVDDDPESVLMEREKALTGSTDHLFLDLQRVESLIQTVGRHHPALGQAEEQYTSSRSVCLRWSVRDQPILIGFDSPQNVYFWNTLLQQSLSSGQQEKITAFSHRSQPFDPGLFSGFGFSREVVDNHIDIVEMNDKELAMIYAAESLIEDAERIGRKERAIEIVTRRLDPLWRRISRPLVMQSEN